MKRRAFSVLLAICMLLMLLPTPALAAGFSGGDGSEADPYQISAMDDLLQLAAEVNGGTAYEGVFFKLIKSLEHNTGVLKEDGTLADDTTGFIPWVPIGSSSNSFQGIFDGGNHTVSGLYCKVESSSYDSVAGLFGYLGAGGKIKNVGVKDSYFSNAASGGGVCAASYGDIENCWNESTVEGLTTMSSVGGVCGTNMGGSIKGCYNTGTVLLNADMAFAGGVCGFNSPDPDNSADAALENCYNTGSVSASGSNVYVGGVCGLNGDINAFDDESALPATVRNCYNTGAVSADSDQSYVGGVCGSQVPGGTFANCYYLAGETGQGGIGADMSGGGTTDTVIEKTAEEFAGGEVAYLLQSGQAGDPALQVWGQTLSGEERNASPVLSGEGTKAVYQVTFQNGGTAHATVYANPSGVGTGRMPAAPEPANNTVAFYRWSQTNDTGGEAFTDSTALMGDRTVYAVWREKFGQAEGEKTVTTTYGTAAEQDLSAYMTYAGGTETAGKFDYEITVGNDNNYFTVSGDTLTVSDATPAKTYELTITATEKAPQLSLLSTRAVSGAETVILNVTVTVNKTDQNAPSVTINYAGETLTTTGAMEWSVGSDTWTTCTENMAAADFGWDGSAEKTVQFRWKGDSNHNDGAPLSVTIPARPPEPGGIAAEDETSAGNDGRITGLTDGVEYQISDNDGETWEDAILTGTEITGLAPGDYQVRCKAANDKFASKAVPVTVKAYQAPPTPVTPDPDDRPAWENPFVDVKETDWFFPSVRYVCENSLFYGMSDTAFSPNGAMTRGMLVTVLYRLAEEPESVAGNVFNDVADGMYYYAAIAWAAENGVVVGYGNGRFGPEDLVTREQLAAILWRYTSCPESAGDLDTFTDSGKASEYAVPALRWAVEKQIVVGRGGGVLDPRGNATRAEAAAMLMRYCADSPQETRGK